MALHNEAVCGMLLSWCHTYKHSLHNYDDALSDFRAHRHGRSSFSLLPPTTIIGEHQHHVAYGVNVLLGRQS